jgi:hypothetical protein
MNALVYNYQILMDMQLESVMLHSSYLLLNKTIAAGSTRQQYQLFLKKQENFNEKLKFLEAIYKDHAEFEEARKGIRLFKDFKKIKHPPPHLIAAHKKFQKVFEAEYENQTGVVVRTMDELRVIAIDELAPHGYFDWVHLNDEKLRVPGEEEKHVSVQDMLQLLPGQFAGEPFLFVLPIGLFSPGDSFTETYRYDAALPPSMENISFLHTCFELPNVLQLTSTELHTVKMQLQDSCHLFDKAMDRWLQLCNQHNADASTIDFFRLEVLPAAESFQTALHNNVILNQYRNAGNDKQLVHFSLGEISLCEVWRLFRKREMIPRDDVWNEMTALMDEPQFKQPRPFLMLSAIVTEEEEETDESIPFKKKSLSID